MKIILQFTVYWFITFILLLLDTPSFYLAFNAITVVILLVIIENKEKDGKKSE